LESLGAPGGVSVGPGGAGGGGGRLKKKRDSQASYTSDMMESESDFRDLEMNMDIIDEYYYGVRIFPGQDPSQVTHFYGWRRGVVVSGVRRMNEVNARRVRLVPGWVTVLGRYTVSVCNKPTRSTLPCIPPRSLNRVPASAGVKAGMSPLPSGR